MKGNVKLTAAVLATLATLGLSQSIHAATQTWTGAGLDLVWQNAANWSGNAVPGVGDTAEFNGAGLNAGDVVLVNSAQTIQQLLLSTSNPTFGGTGSLTLNSAKVYYTGGTPSINTPLTTGSFDILSGGLNVNGSLSSGTGLTKTGGGTLNLTGSAAAVSGDVTVSRGTLSLSGLATFNGVTNYSISGGSTLQIVGGLADSIRDDATIHMRSGTLLSSNSYERVGTIYADAGRPMISTSNTGSGVLAIGSVVRAAGAMVGFGTDLQNGIRAPIFATLPTLNDNMLGGWAYDPGASQWLSVNSDGAVRRYAGTSGLGYAVASDINAAVATDNVRVTDVATAPVVLGASKTINSLILAPTSSSSGTPGILDLNGNTLTLDTGGLGAAEYVKVTNGSLAATGDELFVYSNATNRQLELNGVVTGASTKLVVGSGNVVLSDTNTFGGGVYLNGGYFRYTDAALNDNTLFVDGGVIQPSAASAAKIVVGSVAYFPNQGMDSATFNGADQFSGTANSVLAKTAGDGNTVISGSNPNMHGLAYVTRGSMDLNAAQAIGDALIQANPTGNGATVNYGAAGAAGAVEVFANGTVSINNDVLTPLTAADKFTIHSYGRITGTSARLAQLTYGASNLVLEENAIIGATGIVNLPNDAKWFYSGGMATNMEIGAGTPWKGLSANNGALSVGTSIKAKSDFYLNGIAGSNGADVSLNAGGDILTDTTPFIGYITSIASGRGAILNDSAADYSGVSKFVVTNGAELEAAVATAFGGDLGSAIPTVEVLNGGALNLNVANALNANTTIKSGGIALADIAGGWTGTGVVTTEPGAVVHVTAADALNGTQLSAATLGAGTVVRMAVDNIQGINSATNPLVYEVYGGTRIQTGAANLTLNGSTLTNDASGRTLNVGAGGDILIGASGATLAATTGTTLTINEVVNAGANTLNVGAAGLIDGLAKKGTVNLAGTNTITGLVSITNGATLQADTAARIGTPSAMQLNDGNFLAAGGSGVTIATASLTASGNSAVRLLTGSGTTQQIDFASLTMNPNTVLTAEANDTSRWIRINGVTTLNGTNTLNTSTPGLPVSMLSRSLELVGDIQGTGTLVKTGDGQMAASYNSGNISFTGDTTIKNGEIRWNRTGLAAGTPVAMQFGTGMINLDGGAFRLSTVTAANSPATMIELTNGVTVSANGGSLIVSAGTNQNIDNTFSGNIALGGLLQIGGNHNYERTTYYSGTITVDRTSSAPRGLLGSQEGSLRFNNISGNIIDSATGIYSQPVVMRQGDVSGLGNTYSTGTLIESPNYYNQPNENVEVFAGSKLGTGNVELLPGGRLKLREAAANIASGAKVYVPANGLQAAQVEINEDIVPSFLSSDSNGILALAGNNTLITDMATLGNGSMFLGGTGGNLSSATLAPGAGSTYRFATNNTTDQFPGGSTPPANFTVSAVLGDVGATSSNVLVGTTAYSTNTAGRTILNAVNAYTGSTSVVNGNFGVMAQATGSALGATTALNMKGGSFEFVGVTGVVGTAAVPATSFDGSNSQIGTRLGGAGSTLDLNLGAVTRSNRGTASVYAGSGTLGTSQNVRVNSGLPATNGIVAPWVMEDAGYFLNNDPTNGLVRAVSTSNINVVDPNAVVDTGAIAMENNNTVYALRMSGNITSLNPAIPNTLTLRSGGLISTGNTFAPNLIFADGATPVEGIINVTGNTMAISGTVTAAQGLTKTGAGVLSFTGGINNIVGDITVNRGALLFTNPRQLGADSNTVVLNGGQLGAGGTSGTTSYLNQNIRLGDLGGTFNWDARGRLIDRGNITGTGPLVITGATNGNLRSSYTLDSATPNTYSGGTMIRMGIVDVGLTSSLGTGDVFVDNGIVNLYGNPNIASTAKLTLASASKVTMYANQPTVGALAGVGTLNLSSSNVQLGGASDSVFYGNINQMAGVTGVTKVGANTQTLKGLNNTTGGTTVTAGKLIAAHGRAFGNGTLNATGGTAQLQAGVGPLMLKGVSASGTGKIDLTNGGMVVDYTGATPAASISGLLQSGFASGAWNGNGINSSVAAANPGMSLGLADNASLGLATFQGEAVDSSSILVKYTYTGDLNFDGVVNGIDLSVLGSSWQGSGLWANGDLNYDGVINGIDLSLLGSNWQAGVAAPLNVSFAEAAGAMGMSVPEPASLAVVGLGTLALGLRRRRHA